MTNLNGITLPTCEILVNGQKRKLYGKKKNKIYLHNGDNFQLKLFNPLQERIGAQLLMNGQKVDNSLLILNPGQEINVDRYIGSNNKLKFSAYEIDTTNMSESRVKEAVKAIEKNGKLEIIFWNEKVVVNKPVYTSNYISGLVFSGSTISPTAPNTIIINNGSLTMYDGSGTSGWSGKSGTSGACGASGTSGTGGNGSKGSKGLAHFTNVSNDNSTNISFNCNGMGNIMTSQGWGFGYRDLSKSWHAGSSSEHLGLDLVSVKPTDSSKIDMFFVDYKDYIAESTDKKIDYDKYIAEAKNKIETGRIEKGSKSDQYFTNVSFEAGSEFYKIKFKLLPFSMRPVKKNSTPQMTSKM